MKKTCSKCDEEKNITEFYRSGEYFRPECKKCKNTITTKFKKKNPNKVKATSRKYYLNNKEDILRRNRKWRQANQESVNYSSNIRKKKRLKVDINYRLSETIRKRVRNAIKGKQKPDTFLNSLGCSLENLKIHLEKQFDKGMNWQNHGFGKDKWHIDHIRPLASFDLTDKDQFLEACNYINLQPLWQTENLKKGSKYE